MTESTYAAMRAYIDVAVELKVEKATQPLHEEIRSLRGQLETRSAVQPIAGLPGKDGPAGPAGPRGEKGDTGERGADAIGKDGRDGKDGAPSTVPGPKGDTGEHGKDGIATRAEIEAIVEQRAADITVRTFADTYKGVFKPDELYTRGVLTTWGGSLWLSLVDTKRKPGDNNTDWRLIVKSGRDAHK